jgi:hypothetical protein
MLASSKILSQLFESHIREYFNFIGLKFKVKLNKNCVQNFSILCGVVEKNQRH